jgi:multicomponent Na+:H+ antiporter subunit A
MFFGPAVIAATGLVIGIIPGLTVNGLLTAAASSTSGFENVFKMKLWHGFNLVLVLSLITLIAGFLLLAYWDRYFPRIRNFRFPEALQPAKIYDYALAALFALGKFSTKSLQNGYMGNYILFIMITFIALGYTALVNFTDFSLINTMNGIHYYELALALVMASAAVMAVKSTGRLTAIASMGIVGFGVAMIFMMYGAPDLAMTQFSIETLTVILFVLVIYKLPKFVEYSGMKTRIRDFIMAASVGLFMTFIMLVTTYGDLNDEFKNYFSENSYTVAKGKNIVNVILVDFRAIDTLGEITVLAIAAIGVFALLKLRPEENK